jgi:aromatic ring-opening dioxygenase LigB subunit
VICFAAIAPHGELDDVPELRTAMEELRHRCEAAAPEAVVVVTPHNVHVEGHFAVVVSARMGGHEVDRELAAAVLAALRAERLPAAGVSYGGNDPAEAEMPLDWGTEVPLRYVQAPRVVVVSPARDRPLAEHVRAGRAIASATGRRIALIASADHGHAHDPDGPYGYDPAAARYDELLQQIVRSAPPLDFRPLAQLVAAARADSLWQLLVLQGAVGEDAGAEALAYAAPTYYGMLVATVSL